MIALMVAQIWAESVSVGALVEPDIGATWVFPIHHQGAWFVALGQQQDLWLAPMDESSWSVNMEQVRNLSQEGGLIDHALRPCGDGTWLHTAFRSFEEGNLFWFYDSNFDQLSSGSIAHASNDPVAVCGDLFQGVGAAEQQSDIDFWWDLHEGVFGAQEDYSELVNSPRLTGAGVVELDEQLFVVGRDLQPELVVQSYDVALQPLTRTTIPASDVGIMNYWPTALELVGDKILMVTMGRDPQEPWLMDSGDLYLAVLDHSWNVESWTQLTDFNPEEGGGMRPWMARSGGQVLIGFDRNNQAYWIPVELDELYFGLVAEEEPETNKPEPVQEVDPKEEGCRGQAFMWLPMLLLGGVRRSKRQ